MIRLVMAFILLATGPALPQQRTIFGSDGRVQGRIATDSQGSTVIYDAGGRVTGRTSTDSQGTTRLYAPNGSSVGTMTGGGVTFGGRK